MAEILNCEKREETGTLRMRRLRQSGSIPAILYGRGETVSLTISSRDIFNAVRHGSRIVELQGDVNESALIKDVQWDPLGDDVLHLDLTRIDASEVVDLTLQVHLVGEAPGTHHGGTLKHLLHEVEVACPANMVPEKLELKINSLELDGALTAKDIPLPEGASMLTPADEMVAQCVVVVEAEVETADDAGAAAEPEVIGRKTDDEEGGEES
ncbi:MAG: 50S ribosomal protein L25 [Mariniblastus sp.]|nr:50S ribosomal protein L25 [Mariniblastus sp.]